MKNPRGTINGIENMDNETKDAIKEMDTDSALTSGMSEGIELKEELLLDALNDPEFLEKLADLKHDRWSRWEIYRQDVMNKEDNVSREKWDGWQRKRKLKYSELTEKEKESDRVEARKTLELIKEQLKVI